MKPIAATTNPFGGILPKPEALDPDPAAFAKRLRVSLAAWKDEGYRVVWLEVAIAKAALIPVAVEAGFAFHHSSDGYLMLTLQLEEGAYVPAHASHYIGAGGVVLNEARELLVVSEKYHRRAPGPPRYKLPGGALHAGEHLAEAVVREVAEETGVETEFDALVCFRHWHGYRFGKSDIYFVCRLRPLSTEISIQEDEIAECRWMPVADYLAEENVSAFNKQIVEAALNSTGVRLTEMEGYGTPEQYEFFMPPELGRKGSDREQKLERQNQERLAAVYLDPTAQQLIDALYRKTSIRWEDLPNMVEGEPHDVLRSVVLLAGANLCEASPTRLRLSAYGDKLLATEAEQANSEVERQPVR